MPFWFSSERLVKVSAYTGSLPPNQQVEVSFDTEVLDLGGYFVAAQPSAVVIPPGLGGWYLIHCTVRLTVPEHVTVVVDPAQEAAAIYYAWLKHNGQVMSNEARATANRVTGGKGTSLVMALETKLAAGDTLGLVLWQGFPASYIAQINARSFLTLRRIRQLKVLPLPIFKAAKVDPNDLQG